MADFAVIPERTALIKVDIQNRLVDSAPAITDGRALCDGRALSPS